MTVVLFGPAKLKIQGDTVQLARNRPERTGKSSRTTWFKNMSPEDRVNMAVEMSSVVSTITMESILDQNPRISKAKLIQEGRKRFRSGRRAS